MNQPLDHRPHNHLALGIIAQNANHGTWRTEAMRSYLSPRLLHIARGQGRITIAGVTRRYGPNHLIYIPAKTMFGFEIGPGVLGHMLTIPAAMTAEWPLQISHLRLPDVMAQKDFRTRLDALERELNTPLPDAARAAHHHLGLLAVFFSRQLAHCALDRERTSSDSRAKSASGRLVAGFTQLIELHFHEHLTITDYAGMLGVTPTHLTRCCQQMCGKSALALLNERIIFEARVLLRQSAVPIQKIATDLGFSSPAYFARAFQLQTGQTPSQFRKKGPLSAV